MWISAQSLSSGRYACCQADSEPAKAGLFGIYRLLEVQFGLDAKRGKNCSIQSTFVQIFYYETCGKWIASHLYRVGKENEILHVRSDVSFEFC